METSTYHSFHKKPQRGIFLPPKTITHQSQTGSCFIKIDLGQPSRSPMACKAQRRTVNVESKQQTYQETQSNAIIEDKGCRYIIPVGRDAGQCRRQCNTIPTLQPRPGPGGGHSGPFDTGASPSNGQAGGSATSPLSLFICIYGHHWRGVQSSPRPAVTRTIPSARTGE